MKRLFAVTTFTIALTTGAYAATFGPLVEAEDLSSARADTNAVVLDIRGPAYGEGHIEGAVSVPYGLFRGPKDNPGQLFDVEKLEGDLEKAGLTLDQPIVIVSAGETSSDFGAAARVYWSLKSTGFTDLSILNGGQASWEAAGLPTSTETVVPTPTELDLTFNEAWHAGTNDVSKVVKGEASATLVDSRFASFYEGDKAHPAAKRPGTLPGAVNHSFASFFNEGEPAIAEIADVNALKAELQVEDGQDVVSFCNTGHWAATHWFAVSELAGIDNAKLYPGSMVEYSNAGLPMENTPGLLQNLIDQVSN